MIDNNNTIHYLVITWTYKWW